MTVWHSFASHCSRIIIMCSTNEEKRQFENEEKILVSDEHDDAMISVDVLVYGMAWQGAGYIHKFIGTFFGRRLAHEASELRRSLLI